MIPNTSPKLYEDNQTTTKRVSEDRITPRSDLLTSCSMLNTSFIKIFEILETRSNMLLSDLNSKPHYVKSLRDIIYCVIGVRFYPPPGS